MKLRGPAAARDLRIVTPPQATGWAGPFRFLLDLTGSLQQLAVKAEVAIEMLRDRSQRQLCARVSEGVETITGMGVDM